MCEANLEDLCCNWWNKSRILTSKNLKSCYSTRKPLLKPTDRIKRRKWAKERLHWTDEDWAKVIFSDESNFEVFNRKGRVYVKRYANEKYLAKMCTPRLQGGGGSVGIWGCFSFLGTGVNCIYRGRINQETYIKVLEDCIEPCVLLLQPNNENWIYQQDNAPAHTANSVK